MSAALVALVIAGCSSKAALVGAGGACEQVTDCAPGLICVPNAKTGTSTCSADLSGVQQLPPSPDAGQPDSAAPNDAGDAAASEGGTNPVDSGMSGNPDTAAPPPKDSGTPPVDSGPPPPADTGPPPVDSSAPDTSAPGDDGGGD